MRIENGALVIRDGFTHYPQSQAKYRFFPGDRELPTRILLLDGSGTLSFDVLTWLSQQSVALLRVSWNGEIACVASGTGYAAVPAKIEWQRKTKADEALRTQFAADLIQKKLSASLKALYAHFPHSPVRESAVDRLKDGLDRVERRCFKTLPELVGIEGTSAAAYFTAWHGMELSWKGLGQRPIPKSWSSYDGRRSLVAGKSPKNRNASHPLNAMLNYAYAVKLSAIQLQAVADGYDPTLGILHDWDYGAPALALDLIEPERPIVDAAVLKLVRDKSFAATDFIIKKNGVCRLSPQLARVVAAAVG